jgi:hypothetical protein
MRATMRFPQILALLALTGCAHLEAGTSARRSPTPADYFPLAVGNEWIWEDQSPQLPADRRGATRTVRIVERTADGFYRDSERGELRATGDCVRDRVRQLLCLPFTAGAAWKSVVSVSSTEKYQIAALDETQTTPAGVFRGCIRVRAINAAGAGAELVHEISYAPGVGPVRIETFAVVDGAATPQLRAVLKSYRLEGR